MPKFYKFISLLRESQWNKIKYHTFLEITDLFKRIVEYLFGETKRINENYWNITEQPDSQKQNFIKNSGFFELLTDIIYLSDKHLSNTGGNKFWLHKSLKMSYNVLRYSI